MSEREPLLKVEGLKQYFRLPSGATVKAVDGVSFEIYPGEIYGLVGESGSGKSTIGKAVIRLLDPTEGSIVFKGEEISGCGGPVRGSGCGGAVRGGAGKPLSRDVEKRLRRSMQMIFQDPMASLNPRKCIGDIVGEGLDNIRGYKSREERKQLICEMLNLVGINPLFYDRYPYQFSGGQRQRVGIARALIMKPDLIIADECISALDMSIQAQIVNLLKDIRDKTGVSILFIAHDLSMVKYLSDRIGVLHLGHLLETGTTDEIFHNPVHPYTQSLVDTILSTNPIREKLRKPLTYDYASSGLDYSKGEMRLVEGEHWVLL